MEQDKLVLSVQVLSEFFMVVSRRIKNPLSASEAGGIIETLGVLPVQEIDFTMVKRAIDTSKTYQISYWDSLIIAAAERSGCLKIYSEDLTEGQSYHNISIYNPFKK